MEELNSGDRVKSFGITGFGTVVQQEIGGPWSLLLKSSVVYLVDWDSGWLGWSSPSQLVKVDELSNSNTVAEGRKGKKGGEENARAFRQVWRRRSDR